MSSNPIGENEPKPYASGKPDIQTSQTNPDIPHVSGVPTSPSPKTDCEITCKTEKNRWDKFKDGAEIFGIAVLAVYAGFTIAMYYANKQAADAATMAAEAAQCSADIAARALDSSNEALHLTERAWVGIERIDGNVHLGRDEPLSIDVTIVNSGREPALKLEIATQVGCVPKDSIPPMNYTKRDAAKYGHFVLVPGQEFHGHPPPDKNSKNVCASPEAELVRTGKGFFYILGTIYYEDTFKLPHHTDFCGSLIAEDPAKGYRPCLFHNDAD